MVLLYLKSGKTIDVTDLEAIYGTIWVKKIDYKRSGIDTKTKKLLHESLKGIPRNEL